MNPAHPVNKIMAAVRRLTDALDAAEDADLTIALNAVRPERSTSFCTALPAPTLTTVA